MIDILALDIATTTGWARGFPRGTPTCGSIRFASAGASQGAIMAGAFDWFRDFIDAGPLPDVLVIEEQLPAEFKRGKTTRATGEVLGGLNGVIRMVAFKRRIFKVHTARVDSVRHHFIGGNYRRDQAKRYVVAKAKSLGWLERDDSDAGDALALWSYWSGKVEPETALRVSPLFAKGIQL